MLSSRARTHLTIYSSIFTTSGALGFIANFLQIMFITRDKKQRSSVFGIILLSLSISDISVSLVQLYRGSVCLPYISLVIDHELYVKLTAPADVAIVFSLTSTFCHVVFIALLRVIALMFPLRVKQLITKTRSKIILAFLWLLSISLVVISYFTIRDELCAYLAIITSGILLLAYSVVCCRMCKQSTVLNNESTQRYRQQTDKDVIIYSMALTFIFCLCNIPAALYYFMKMPYFVPYINVFLYSINPFLDTLLYFFSSYCRQRRRESIDLRNENDLIGTMASRMTGKMAGSTQTIEEDISRA